MIIANVIIANVIIANVIITNSLYLNYIIFMIIDLFGNSVMIYIKKTQCH